MSRGMYLSELLPGTGHRGKDIYVQGLSVDSRRVAPNELFLACPGGQSDGRHYMDDALNRGAAAVLAEQDGLASTADQRIIPVPDLYSRLGEIADRFYASPSAALKLFGVTGTNGKTSSCYWIAAVLDDLEVPCAAIGTLGCSFAGRQIEPPALTMPVVTDSQRLLALLRDSGARAVAMEVSSHGLAQGRDAGLRFSAALFTNFGRDHLDYHTDLDDYLEAKLRLFSRPELRRVALNADDPVAPKVAASTSAEVISYGLNETAVEVRAESVELSADGINALIHTPWGSAELNCALLGRFNLYNLLGVIALLVDEQLSVEKIVNACNTLTPPPGRLQRVESVWGTVFVIDFAHTAEALEAALIALRPLCRGKLWCVFGCGGDRDAGKRPVMGEVASRLADEVVITSDNPRFESPQTIIEQIREGASVDCITEPDRRQAIQFAVTTAAAEDVVLIAGKGAENYQQIGTRREVFSDLDEVQRCLRMQMEQL